MLLYVDLGNPPRFQSKGKLLENLRCKTKTRSVQESVLQTGASIDSFGEALRRLDNIITR